MKFKSNISSGILIAISLLFTGCTEYSEKDFIGKYLCTKDGVTLGSREGSSVMTIFDNGEFIIMGDFAMSSRQTMLTGRWDLSNDVLEYNDNTGRNGEVRRKKNSSYLFLTPKSGEEIECMKSG